MNVVAVKDLLSLTQEVTYEQGWIKRQQALFGDCREYRLRSQHRIADAGERREV